MNRRTLLPLLLTIVSTLAFSAERDSISAQFQHRMDSLIRAQQLTNKKLAQQGKRVTLNPYFYRLMVPGTLYSGSINRMMNLNWNSSSSSKAPSLGVNYQQDNMMDVAAETDRNLAAMYVNHPELIVRTEEELQQEPKLREEVTAPMETEAKLTDKVVPVELDEDVPEAVEFQARRPHFWKLSGSGSLQFTQSYYSDNWYQGGEKNYAALAAVTLEANYDNKQKIQWDNKLEAQLGFQTSKDECHNFKATSNLLRVTSKLGYKAAKSWYYTGQAQAYTQFVPNYNSNSYTFASDFASPLYFTLSVGMDYKFKSKKEKFTGSLLLSPVAYNMRYVRCDSLRSRYSVEEGKVAYHNFGPSLTLNYKWIVCKNVMWEARLYYFTNLHYVDVEWENTFTFTINRFLSSKFFVYPRFDDSSKAYHGKHGYLMFKEWLSLGLTYNF